MTTRTRLLLKALVTVSLLAFLAYRMDLETFWQVLSSAAWLLVLVAALVHFSTLFLSVLRWKLVLENFRSHPGYKALLKITLIGYFFNLFLPSAIGGDVLRAYYLSRKSGHRLSTALTTTMIDRGAGLCAILIIALSAVWFHPIRVGGISLLWVLLLLAAAFSIGIVAIFNPWMHDRLGQLLNRFQLGGIEERLGLIGTGLSRLKRNRSGLLLIFTLSLAIQVLVIVSIWFAARSIGIEASFFLFLIFIPVVNLAVAVPLTINGVGLREAVYYLLFSQVGVPVEMAVTLSLLNLMIVAATSLPGGIVYSLYKKETEFTRELTEVMRT